ncbi:MAG: hypothetical protein LBK77_03815 [Spirochaetaceae bacterium]|jgi:hypothetical protein|nr:hypothetical protein [Spirochaetaceae bacterium]
MWQKPFRERMFDKLDSQIADETRSPAQRESARLIRDELRRVWEKRAAMRHCPALCLMELSRATAKGSDRALELAYRYINKDFWNNESFCREALKINPESLEWIT